LFNNLTKECEMKIVLFKGLCLQLMTFESFTKFTNLQACIDRGHTKSHEKRLFLRNIPTATPSIL